ncbi:MAG: hypothetical protein AAF577_01840 [Pseudomonadota bacterium]
MRFSPAIMAATLCLAPFTPAAGLTLDFDRAFIGAPATDGGGNTVLTGRDTVSGEIVADDNGDRGLFVDAFGVEFSVNLGNNALGAVLFESNCGDNGQPGGLAACQGGDPDLATGPNLGSTPRNRLLIFQEQQGNAGNSNNTIVALTPPAGTPTFGPGAPAAANNPQGYARPDDAAGGNNANSVTYNFLASRYQLGVDLEELVLIDFEEPDAQDAGNLAEVILEFSYADGRQNASIDLADPSVVFTATNATGDNSEKIFDLQALGALTLAVRSFSITLDGVSGGIEQLAFQPTAVPLPPSALLLAGAAGALFLRRRRPAAAPTD